MNHNKYITEFIEMQSPYDLTVPTIYYSHDNNSTKNYKHLCINFFKCCSILSIFSGINLLSFYTGYHYKDCQECICNNTSL